LINNLLGLPAPATRAPVTDGSGHVLYRRRGAEADCGRRQPVGRRAARAASSAAGTEAATNSEVRPLRQYMSSLPTRAVHAIPIPETPRARAGLENGRPDTATTASAPPSRQVRSTIRCPPTTTLAGRPTSIGAAGTRGFQCEPRSGAGIAW